MVVFIMRKEKKNTKYIYDSIDYMDDRPKD